MAEVVTMRLLSGECDRIALCSLTAVHGCVWSSNFLKVLDAAKFDVETNEAALASAKAQLEVRRNERDSVAARLGEQSGASPESDPACCRGEQSWICRSTGTVSGAILKDNTKNNTKDKSEPRLGYETVNPGIISIF
ncbi:hypothetical protein [Mesorhizobium onobrychidis]|uniref:Uncharacterized protein n=1 Tax=Mesorhizobium onobrychidis TaxID=2775404 RepID=A0ABY5R7K4_9HYPH|nr:hypothetical protein [Mesorhizobium onobrychidis]UVC19293.1 hypothetical protein IHQ72_12990 [Mesorhizobium onobrychidis]